MNPAHPFSSLTPITVPDGLLERVLQFVDKEVLRRLRIQAGIASALLVSSVTYTSLFWNDWMAYVQESAFADYVRIALSDPDIVFESIGLFLSGVLESLPISALLLGFLNTLLLVSIIGFLHRLHLLQRLQLIFPKH